jgi:arylsulfatase A-like enzyme
MREDTETIDHIRYTYAALLTFCDAQLGRVLDMFDKHNMWEDTMLIVNTDHGAVSGPFAVNRSVVVFGAHFR